MAATTTIPVQIIDVSTFPHNDTKLNLSMHALKGYQYMPNTIRRYDQRGFANLLAGERQYGYFINKVSNGDYKELYQLCHRVPANEGISTLDLSRNYIIYFPHQVVPRNIVELNLSKNQIQEIGSLAQHLNILKYSHNPIKTLPNEIPPNLRKLAISNTNITALPNLPVTLTQLSIRHTQIRQLPDNFMDLTRLNNFKMDGNPQLVITEEQLAFIDIVFERRRRMQPLPAPVPDWGEGLEGPRDVYGDGQNVHDSTVNSDIVKNVDYLLEKPCLDCKKIFGSGSTHSRCNSDKINEMRNMLHNKEVIRYFIDDIGDSKFGELAIALIIRAYFNHLLSFSEEIRTEILKMLDSDLLEMRHVCTTGRVARLVNSLVGFDPKVEIKIADTAQIQAKYNLVNSKYKHKTLPPVVKVLSQAWLFYNLLQEIVVKAEVMKVWMEPFVDSMIEDHLDFIMELVEGKITENDSAEKWKYMLMIKDEWTNDYKTGLIREHDKSMTDLMDSNKITKEMLIEEKRKFAAILEVKLNEYYQGCLTWIRGLRITEFERPRSLSEHPPLNTPL